MTGAGENGLPMARAPRGRGAGENPANRYHRQHVEAFDDGWSTLEAEVACGGALPTEVSPRSAKSIIARNESPDIPFEQSINPYQGCEHGCVYCFARPTHAYWDLSPGLDFETKIVSKPNAPDLLRKELGRRSYRCSPIALGTNTDPYQPVERSLGITRQVLEVLVEARHPFSIVTKSAGVLRDLDLISEAARAGRALVCLSVTTLDGGLASRLEPRAAAPRRRLDTMQALAEAGVPVGVMASPMIPALTDHELEAFLEGGVRRGRVDGVLVACSAAARGARAVRGVVAPTRAGSSGACAVADPGDA